MAGKRCVYLASKFQYPIFSHKYTVIHQIQIFHILQKSNWNNYLLKKRLFPVTIFHISGIVSEWFWFFLYPISFSAPHRFFNTCILNFCYFLLYFFHTIYSSCPLPYPLNCSSEFLKRIQWVNTYKEIRIDIAWHIVRTYLYWGS